MEPTINGNCGLFSFPIGSGFRTWADRLTCDPSTARWVRVSGIKLGNKRRLSVVEVTAVDGRRRMVLVRRDDVEHLLLISPTSETVIERGITTANGNPIAIAPPDDSQNVQ